MNENSPIDFTKIFKAQGIFERFRKDMINDRDKAGAIQSFEFCYELAWKMMKRVLESRGMEVGSPKDTFRKAALEGMIDDPEVWFEFQMKKNLSSHTYEQENVDAILLIFDRFSYVLSKFLQKIGDFL